MPKLPARTVRWKRRTLAEEKGLIETINMLQRAIRILVREMSKGGAAMVQMKMLAVWPKF